MKIPTTPRLLAVFLTGILYPLCFPNLNFGWLAWIMLVPLHLAVDGLSPKQSFWWGWFAGTLGFAGTVSWVITAMHSYGQVPLVISMFLMILLAGYLGLYIGLYTLGLSWFKPSPHITWLVAPCLWVALELLRTYLFSGFPWALLGYSQYQWLSVIQIADMTSVYGISFIIVLTNVMIYQCICWGKTKLAQDQTPFPWPTVAATIGILGLTLAYGTWQLDQHTNAHTSARSLRIGVVQGNIDQARKWDETYRQETVNRYNRLSRQAAADNTDLLIWPESATPFFFEREPHYQQQVAAVVQETNTPLLFGSPTLRRHQDGSPYLMNSAYLLMPQGQIAGRYDKRHLVPFGEYIPLRSILFFLDKLVVGIGDFRSGVGPMTVTLPQQDARPSLNFGVAICFEVIFPNLVRRMAKEGADFLVTITNDAWFGDSVAPYQHFGMVVFRAVENRVAFARSANTGISGFIAPTGHILATTPIFTQEALTGTIPLRTTTTFYSQNGDVFAWSCVILLTICAWTQRRRTRQTNHAILHS